MYVVKPNGNYNIILNDIGISIQATGEITIEKSTIDNSIDAQNLIKANLLLVEDFKSEKVKKIKQEKEVKNEDTVFVAREEATEINKNIFVREPETSPEDSDRERKLAEEMAAKIVDKVEVTEVVAPLEIEVPEVVETKEAEIAKEPEVKEAEVVKEEKKVTPRNSTKSNAKTTSSRTTKK